MYPWEHLLLGYLLYSMYVRLRHDRPPSGGETLVVVFGSQLPDLIDKPLAWTFGVVETGYAIGHSIFVAPFMILIAFAASKRVNRPQWGMAFTIPYLSHLGSDIIYPIAFGRSIEPRVVLWPVASPPQSTIHGGFIERTTRYLNRFWQEVTAGEPTLYLVFQLAFLAVVVLLWLLDGAPVLTDILERARSAEKNPVD